MVQARASVTIDLGNSETRVRVSYNQGGGNKRIKRLFTLSNRFASVEGDYVVSEDYNSETSTIIRMDEDVNRGIVGGSRFVNGVLAAKEFYDGLGKPTAMEKKFNSMYAKLSFNLAMLYAHRSLMSILRVTSLESMDITWKVVVLLPPGDLVVGTPIIEEMIRGTKELTFDYPNITIPLKVDRIGVFAEGFCSYIGVVFEDDFSVRAGYEKVVEDTTIVFDIGAGTTDILIIQGNKIIQKTLTTINEGGNQVSSRVRAKAKNRLGGKVSEVAISEAMQTGFVKSGSSKIDISDIIKEEKESFARNIVAEIKEFFELTSFPVNEIGNALVCGGGAIDSEMDGASEKTGSMAVGIVNFMKRISPNIELLPLPVIEIITSNESGEAEKTSTVVSPRLLNLIGGSILADM